MLATALFTFLVVNHASAQPRLKVKETRKIYDNNSYCAFTGLTSFKGKYYCTFREASNHHINHDDPTTWGKIVLLESKDAREWNKVAVFEQDSIDMRDPKIKTTPDGKHLMLLYHKHRIFKNTHSGGYSVVRLFDGSNFIAREHDICVKGYEKERVVLWNTTNYNGKIYGFASGTIFMFVASVDGVNYEPLNDYTIWSKDNGRMNESNVVFVGKKAYAVARADDDQGYFGESRYPFKKWRWRKMNISVAGPNLFQMNRKTLLLGSRDYGHDNFRGNTVIYRLNKRKWDSAERIIVLDSTKDSSYPCILKVSDNHLMVSYYSGDAKHSNIYVCDIVIE